MQEIAEFAGNNLLLVTGFLASGFAVLFYEIRLKGQNIGSISTMAAVRVINGGYAVVDIRPPEQFADGHLVDAANMPEADLNAEALGKNKKGTLLVCDSGIKSSTAAASLRTAGLENVFSLKGGIAAWQQENLPVVSGES